MIPVPTPNSICDLGAPPDWDEARDGPCVTLPVEVVNYGGTEYMVSTWMPTGDEWNDMIAARARGGNPCFRLGIRGHPKTHKHPVVMVWVE